ncbi:MAG: hypothetical protein AB9907_09600 [Flexilinea sp.]|jgi:hypothetical protein
MNLTETSLVLVAIMPKARDMEIARILGWYRIPLKSAPKILRVDYIAFYQTADFGPGHKSCIEKYAEVTGVELTTRSALLKDEPDHPRATEEYFKIQLGPLQTLKTPIPADSWKRFLFFYTTGEKFFTAERIHDLAVCGSEKEILWHSLRERMETGSITPEPEAQIPQDLLFLLGNLSLSNLDL